MNRPRPTSREPYTGRVLTSGAQVHFQTTGTAREAVAHDTRAALNAARRDHPHTGFTAELRDATGTLVQRITGARRSRA